IRIMRFGPVYSTVENEAGELLANAGTYPFKVPHDFLQHKDRTFMGTFDPEIMGDEVPQGYGGPSMPVTAYRTYHEFKDDYVNNPVYLEMRSRKARAVAAEWALMRGEIPPDPVVINVGIRTTSHVLKGQDITRFFLDDDEGEDLALASVTVDAVNGGLQIRGGRVGAAPLTVQTAAGVRHYELIVSGPGGPSPSGTPGPQGFTPGWQPYLQWVTPGGFAATPRYWQAKDGHRWCPQVGCGPVAWAMLFGWWDNKDVPAAFYADTPDDFTANDAPLSLVSGGTTHNSYLHVKEALHLLHDFCDVIFSAGATPPGDMIEGGIGYLIVPFFHGKLGFSTSWAWDLTDPDWNEPTASASRSRRGGPRLSGWAGCGTTRWPTLTATRNIGSRPTSSSCAAAGSSATTVGTGAMDRGTRATTPFSAQVSRRGRNSAIDTTFDRGIRFLLPIGSGIGKPFRPCPPPPNPADP
ncbi:MAG TPA: hypothetical protein DCY13_02205, partial [Verrucomicrobiales bacterium]|nr:hypothetical protein [Verrucomicrobiales bacterium]